MSRNLYMEKLGEKAKLASLHLSNANINKRNSVLKQFSQYLKTNSKKKNSLIETAYDNNVPIFCPAFTDSSAGLGLVMHQEKNPNNHLTIDSVREFRELTEIKIKSKTSGL